jgi:hypothetical protein
MAGAGPVVVAAGVAAVAIADAVGEVGDAVGEVGDAVEAHAPNTAPRPATTIASMTNRDRI